MPNGHGGVPFPGAPIVFALMFTTLAGLPLKARLAWAWVATAAALIIIEMPSVKVAALLALLAWASCRFYDFLFHVLERYVDPTMRYAGLWDLLMGMKRRRRELARRQSRPLP